MWICQYFCYVKVCFFHVQSNILDFDKKVGFKMEIYERLFIKMYEKGIRQRDIFENIEGVTKSTVSSWKTRHTDPPAKMIIPICELLGVSVEFLLTGETSKKSSLCFPKVTITDSDMELLELFRKLPSDKQSELRGEIKGMLRMLEAGAETEKSEAV